MVAAICTWHERHAAAVAAIEQRLDRGDRLVVAAHAIIEAYAVLTRLPAPHRLAHTDAWALINANFVEAATVVALSGSAYVTLLKRLASAGIGGGRCYDAAIALAAGQAKANAILTFNPRHFDPAPEGLSVVEP